MGHTWAALNKKWSQDLRMLLQIFHLHLGGILHVYMQLFSCLYKNKCTDICNNKEQAPFPRFCHLIWVVHWLYSLLVALNTRADLGLSCGSHNQSHLTVLLWLSSLDLTYGFLVALITSNLTVLLWLSSLDLTYGFLVALITRVNLHLYCGAHYQSRFTSLIVALTTRVYVPSSGGSHHQSWLTAFCCLS